jgi:hypothetical protein
MEQSGTVRDVSGFRPITVHEYRRHRYVTDAGRVPSKKEKGKMVHFETFVRARSTAGPTEHLLVLRTLSSNPNFSRDDLVAYLCDTPELIVNPGYVITICRHLLAGKLITTDIVDEVLDERHPVWSSTDWIVDKQFPADFREAKLADDPDMSDEAIEADMQQWIPLMKKEGSVSVKVPSGNQTVATQVSFAAEMFDRKDGRYFLAVSEGCSPYRTGYSKLHGWKNRPRQIEGDPKKHKSLRPATPAWKRGARTTMTIAGNKTVEVNGETVDIMDALKSGHTYRPPI